MVDIAIIGAGINGCFLAHELARYNLKVMVLELGPMWELGEGFKKRIKSG